MIKQLRANGKSSYDDFGLYIKERNPSLPPRRTNKKTVPGMHGSYDFSTLYGEVIYDNRTIEYKFDVTGFNISNLDYERRRVLDWLMNINETEIIDDYSPDYYYFGSFNDASWSEDAEQGLLTVRFSVYPFAISKEPIEVSFDLLDGEEKEITINNRSSHKVIPIINTDNNILIKIGEQRISLSKGEWTIDNFYLEKGENTLFISGTAKVSIKYNEEVL